MSGKLRKLPSITRKMDEGIQKEIDHEVLKWNERDGIERFPLSPSQIGKCGLALARNLAHFLGVGDYPRAVDAIQPRIKRIFSRGGLIEEVLIKDMEKYAGVRVVESQTRVRLFPLSGEHHVEGNIDGILVTPDGTRILVDFKTKGAFYSANFTDSISQFFNELRSTGLVEEFEPNCFVISDAKALFDVLSLDEFFVDYLLQLNAYAFAPEFGAPGGIDPIDFVALYYENKNTCAHYEVRWVPSIELFEYAKNKLQYIYDTVMKHGAEAVPKEFSLGSSRCKLCEHNVRCWGEYVPPARTDRVVGTLDVELDRALKAAQREHHVVAKVEEEVLQLMERKNLTHVQTTDGLVYERKFLKSPKPHFELRLSK